MRSTKGKKGISEMITTILLVGFVVVLGIVIGAWGTKIIKKNIEKSETRIGADLDCMNVNIKISSGSGKVVFVQNNNLKDKKINGFISRFSIGDKVFVDYKNQNTIINAFGVGTLDYSTAKDRNGNIEAAYTGSADKIEVIPKIELDNGEVVDCVKKSSIYTL